MTPADPTFVDDRLSHWAEHDPDGEAITYLGGTWTWAEWNERVRRVAGGLQGLRIGRGDVVALHGGTSATEEELIAHCREHLAAFTCPTSVDIIEALPCNPTGKIPKRDLRKPYWGDRERQTV